MNKEELYLIRGNKKSTQKEITKKILKDMIAIITGGSGHIGSKIVEKFHNEGAKVVFTYYKNKERAMALAKNLGNDIYFIKCDNTKYEEIKNVIDFTVSKFGKIDILVNNAGTGWQGPLENSNKDIFTRWLDVDLIGSYLFCKHTVPIMKKNRFGKIINISSIVSISGLNGHSIHGAVKAALIGFTKNLAIELAPYNIFVNSISPGTIRSNFPDWYYEKQRKNIPLGRPGEPDDIADTCLFLGSHMSDFIIGQNIIVDGGQTLIVRYD